MYQHVVVVGNLGRDPELRYTQSGTPVANFPVATNRRWTDADGNVNEEATWFRVSVFGKQAEACNQYLEKGRNVLCEGEIRTSSYQDQNGENALFLGIARQRGQILGAEEMLVAAPPPAIPRLLAAALLPEVSKLLPQMAEPNWPKRISPSRPSGSWSPRVTFSHEFSNGVVPCMRSNWQGTCQGVKSA